MIAILKARDTVWGNFVACLPKNLNRDSFIAASGAKGGLGQQLVERIYDVLTVDISVLSDEYKTFYAEEYDSLEEFLYWKYDIDSLFLEQFGDCSLEHSSLVLGRLYAGGDNVGWLIEGDNPPEALEAISTILRTLREEITNED